MEESLILIATKSLDIILFGPLIDGSDHLNASNISLNDVCSLSSLYSLAIAVDRLVTSLWNLPLSIAIKLRPSSFSSSNHFVCRNILWPSIENGNKYNYHPVFYMEIIYPTVSDLACEISLVKGFLKTLALMLAIPCTFGRLKM